MFINSEIVLGYNVGGKGGAMWLQCGWTSNTWGIIGKEFFSFYNCCYKYFTTFLLYGVITKLIIFSGLYVYVLYNGPYKFWLAESDYNKFHNFKIGGAIG